MIAIGPLFLRMLCDRFKSPQRLEAEILVLRHQLNVLRQRTPRRRLRLGFCHIFAWLLPLFFLRSGGCLQRVNAYGVASS
jgi:hypothetical protein